MVDRVRLERERHFCLTRYRANRRYRRCVFSVGFVSVSLCFEMVFCRGGLAWPCLPLPCSRLPCPTRCLPPPGFLCFPLVFAPCRGACYASSCRVLRRLATKSGRVAVLSFIFLLFFICFLVAPLRAYGYFAARGVPLPFFSSLRVGSGQT